MKKLGLKYFLLSQKALTLYRQFIKSIAKAPDAQTKSELHQQVRGEFERYRGVTDTHKMEYLIVTGKKQLEMIQAYTHR
jgi:hypothetical protein